MARAHNVRTRVLSRSRCVRRDEETRLLTWWSWKGRGQLRAGARLERRGRRGRRRNAGTSGVHVRLTRDGMTNGRREVSRVRDDCVWVVSMVDCWCMCVRGARGGRRRRRRRDEVERSAFAPTAQNTSTPPPTSSHRTTSTHTTPSPLDPRPCTKPQASRRADDRRDERKPTRVVRSPARRPPEPARAPPLECRAASS